MDALSRIAARALVRFGHGIIPAGWNKVAETGVIVGCRAVCGLEFGAMPGYVRLSR